VRWLAAVLVVLAMAPLQLAIEALAGVSAPVPVLPVAALVAWARVRHPGEAWLAIAPAALVLGAASEVRAGWFLLALLPAPLLAAPRVTGNLRGMAMAGLAGGAGGCLYLVFLAMANAPDTGGLLESGVALRTTIWTGCSAVVFALAMLPLRPRTREMFA
jgi:hypothetical protein